MNKDLFEKSYAMLNEILATITNYIGLKEFNFRSNKLKRVYDKMLNEGKIDDEYYAIAHEVRAIDMFINMGQINVAKDCQNEPGVDLQYKDNLVECVVCTAGNEKSKEILKENGYQVYNIIIDYHAKFKQITLRVLSSLRSKGNKYHYDVKKGVLDSEKPFCIFLNLGGLAQEWFPGKYCNEATRFLVGRGNPILKYDSNTLEQVDGVSYTYAPFINNNNNAEVITNFFGDRENASVSAIIISTAELDEIYKKSNTTVFINPYAKNKLKIKDFWKFPYWRINKEMEYVPRICGKRLTNL